jgi:hypothetical protein
MKNVHLTLEDVSNEHVHHAVKGLISRPLFPDTSSWAQGSRPASNLGMRVNFPAIQITANGHQWVKAQVSSLLRRGPNEPQRAAEGNEGWKSDRTSRPTPLPSVEWCMDSRNRGRRVLLRGLPGMVPESRIRRAAAGYGVEVSNSGSGDGEGNDVKRLPA